jgi:predicted ribosomally synthesized peptide with SipW-like signal peptide
MNKKNTKKALLSSVLSLVLCMAMLIGTTFAWFTDSVTSKNNIIKSGNLDVELNYKDKLADTWKDASEGAIFSYDNWEPGYVEVKYVQIANVGSLAFNYLLNVIPNGTSGAVELGDVIDVYVAPVTENSVELTRDSLNTMTKVGTLSDLIGRTEGTVNGILLPKNGSKNVTLDPADEAIAKTGEATYALALKMQESAGNEYQNLTVGGEGGFTVQVLAKQYTWENDSFDHRYDENSNYVALVKDADALAAALKKGGIIALANDIDVAKEVKIPAGVVATLDLNGYKLAGGFQAGSTEKHIYPLNNFGNLTIENGTIEGRGVYNRDGAKLTINGAAINALDYNGGACVWSYGTGEVYLNDATMVGCTGVVSSEGYVEINGGTYVCYSGINDDGDQVTNSTYNIRAYNGLKITDGTFTSRHGVISVGGGNAIIEDGNFTIQFKAATTSNVVYIYGDANATIYDGEFISDNSANKADSGTAILVSGSNASADIKGGNFVGMNGMVSGNIEITGGTFNTVWNYNHYDKLEPKLAENYKATQNANGAWVVEFDPSNLNAVSEGLYQEDGTKNYYVESAKGLKQLNDLFANKSAGQNATIALTDDIDFAGYTWAPVDSHVDYGTSLKEINGNGHTISNMTINGQAMFTRFAGLGDVVVRDITFDNASVNSNGSINTAVVVGHTYQNVTLDNVDIMNSSICGGYKVAPFIGTVYNESLSTITATLNNCDVTDCVVKATSYDFCTTGMVAFVHAGYNDTIEFNSCTITNVFITAPNIYTAHAAVYTTGSETLFDEVDGVTVTNVTFETLK